MSRSWIIFIVFSCIYFSSMVGIMNSGDGTQYALTKTLVEDKTVMIDNNVSWTYFTDFAYRDGHYYSSREPGQSILAVPFYFLGKFLTSYLNLPYNGQAPGLNSDTKIQLLTIISQALLGSGAVVVLYKLCLLIYPKHIPSLVTAVTYGLGSLHWKYSAGFYRQPLAALFLLSSVYLIIQIKRNNKWHSSLLIGLFLGLVLFVDTTMILAVIALFFWYLTQIFTQSSKTKFLLSVAIGISIPLTTHVLYNYVAFNKFLISPHFFEGNPNFQWQRTISGSFETPIFPSLTINLFSSSPIPPNAIAPEFWSDIPKRNAISAYWATVYPYKGIFVQTPFLILASIGFLHLLKFSKEMVFFIIISAAGIILPLAKLNMFYSPNMYDTRYFLPAVPLLMIGSVGWWKIILTQKNNILKSTLMSITLVLVLASVYYGWVSNLTAYAPNVTGEHRFDFSRLPPLNKLNFIHYVWLLIFNTFPNISNLHFGLLYSGSLFMLWTALKRLRYKLLSL